MNMLQNAIIYLYFTLFSSICLNAHDSQASEYEVIITDAQVWSDYWDTCFQMEFSDQTQWQSWNPRYAIDYRWETSTSVSVKQHWHIGDHLLITRDKKNGYTHYKAINLDRDNKVIDIVPGWSTK